MSLRVLVLFVVFFIANGGSYKYNTETFYIAAKSSRIVTTKSDSDYYVLNVGKPKLTVQILEGNLFTWTGKLAEKDLLHGEAEDFHMVEWGNNMAVKIVNNENINGFVHAYAMGSGFPEFDEPPEEPFILDEEKLFKTLAIAGAAHIPIVGEPLSIGMEFFWPEKKTDVWGEVKDQVSQFVDKRIQDTIDDILGGALSQFKTRIKTILHEIDDPKITETVAEHFVNIAEDLVGFEERFQFKGHNSINNNFFLLPLFSTTVNLKMCLYQYGIKNWQKIGLNKELVGRLNYYIVETVHNSESGAVKYIEKTCKDKIDQDYKDAYPETIYDKFATLREYCALHGFEHLWLWKSIAANPNMTSKPEVPVVVYSTQFGRNTARQSSEMIDPLYPPLTPTLIKNKLNIPTNVIVFLTYNKRIGGMRVNANYGATIDFGTTVGNDKVTIDFKGKKLTELVAWGDGQINGLQFKFEDGRVVNAGTFTGWTRKFKLIDHHIVGFYGTGSLVRIEDGSIANFAVSYQLITK